MNRIKPYQEHPNFLGFFDHEDIANEINSDLDAMDEDGAVEPVEPKDLMVGGKYEALYNDYIIMKTGLLQNVWDNMYDFETSTIVEKLKSQTEYWNDIMTESRMMKTSNILSEHVEIHEVYYLPRELDTRLGMLGTPYCSSLIAMQCHK